MHSESPLRVTALLTTAEAEGVVVAAIASSDGVSLQVFRGPLMVHYGSIMASWPDVLVLDLNVDDCLRIRAIRSLLGEGAMRIPVIATAAGATPEGLRRVLQLRLGRSRHPQEAVRLPPPFEASK